MVIKKQELMMHTKFDAAYWQQESLQRGKSSGKELKTEWLSFLPTRVLLVERSRKLAIANGAGLGPSLPTDLCLFGRGEPPQRHLTKVNGLPYRPRTRPWPRDESGEPLTFLCQFCFADSKDHIAQLPGDVLLVFAQTEDVGIFPGHLPISPAEEDAFYFEWYPLGLDDLVADPSPPLFVFPTCYVVQHRSCDYLNQEAAIEAMSKLGPDAELLKKEFFGSSAPRGLVCWPGMKIGGVPYWDNAPPAEPEGRFLANFSGVGWVFFREYPHFMELEQIPFRESLNDENYFQLPIDCSVNFFVREDGSVTWVPDFYCCT